VAHALFEDVRYAARQVRKDLAVSCVLMLTIALGVGVNTAIFSVINGFFRPLPARSPDQLVVLAAQVKGDETGVQFTYSYPAVTELREQVPELGDVFAFYTTVAGFSTGGRGTQFMYSAVTGNYFSALGLNPAHGRFFAPGEGEAPGTDNVVVLGYGFWQRRLGGDPKVVGTVVRIDGRPATIVGIAPKEFHGTYGGADMDGYMSLRSLITEDAPWRREFFSSRSLRLLTVMGRLREGTSIAQAQVSASAATARMAQNYPATDGNTGVRIIPEQLARPVPMTFLADLVPTIRFFVQLLAGLVLLVASLNVANIQLVRATVRERELAIRAALGSGRGRLMRQMFTESMLVVGLGGAIGLVLGSWTANAIAGSLDLGTDLPTALDFGFDWRVFAYISAITLVAGGLVGMLPALRASRVSIATLHDGSRGTSGGRQRQRVRGALVVGQVAGSLMLLICAGLFVRSLRNAQHMDLGFKPQHLLNARMDPQWAGYSLARTRVFYRELLRRVRTWPDVQSATYTFSVPLSYINVNQTVVLEGAVQTASERPPLVGSNFIDGEYFTTMEIPIVAGRTFRESDDTTSRVAIVNETMAKRFWPNASPIGKRFYSGVERTGPWEIVGVARDSKYMAIFEQPLSHFYVPVEQTNVSMRVLQIRSATPPALLSTRVEREIHAIDPDIEISDLQTMARSLAGAQGFLVFRIGAFQAGGMGLLGLVLALVGVYGVVSYSAAQRSREIGIRMALGGTPAAIRAMFLRQGASFVVLGIAFGIVGAFGLTRILKRFLLLVSAADPMTFVAVPLMLAAVAIWACWIPARRATRVDPMIVLRQD
jgi:macrolide transport system ATP-binding/permease protein